jgi:PAS domain S-box-containing protein
MADNWKSERNKIIGLGENSFKKSYYPELQKKIDELEASRINLDTIINSTSDGIIIHDFIGQILFINKPAETLLELKNENLESITIKDISSAKNKLEDLPHIWEKVKKEHSVTVEWVVLQKNSQKEITVQVSINNTIWDGQEVCVAVLRDFTLRKEYEEKLLIAKEKAEESDKLKTAFLQNMSHEIRTPMNAIMGFADLLNDPSIDPGTISSYTSIIINSSNQLLSIVNNILTMASVETRQERLLTQNVNINTLINELIEVFKEQALARNVMLKTQRPLANNCSEILTDQTKLSQIISNLLNNALKFTHEGLIEVGYSVKDNFLEFYVKDSGIGISTEMHEKIFERFRQADPSIQLNYGGTGLGLSISKGFIELMGGKIWVESEPGKGATFYFTIPYQPLLDDSKCSTDMQTPAEHFSTILVAEDEDFNFQYIETLLKKFNTTEIIHAKDGQEAVDLCKNHPEIKLVLMDIRMPVMDGYTAAQIIKANRPGIVIIAQSAYATQDDIKLYTSPVFDDYITKPLRKEELNQKLNKYV